MLTRQTDARGQRICMYYDKLNRLTGKHYRTDDACPAGPTYNIRNYYDEGTNAIGQRTRMVDLSGATTWNYDTRGQVITGNLITFVTAWGYNSAGLTVQMRCDQGQGAYGSGPGRRMRVKTRPGPNRPDGWGGPQPDQ